MPFWPGLNSPEETAKQLKGRYGKRIRRFLTNNGAHYNYTRANDNEALDQLLDWMGTELSQKSRIYGEHIKLTQDVAMLQAQLTSTQKSLQQSNNLLAQRDSQMKDEKTAHQSELAATKTEHRRQMNDVMAAHQNEMHVVKARHEKEMAQTVALHTEAVNKINREFEVEMKAKEENEKKLLASIMENVKDDFGWSDPKLKHHFNEISAVVNKVSSPHSLDLEARIPPSSLDPTGFFHRHGENNTFFLVRSCIWDTLRRGFFSCPFGFGSLGPHSLPLIQDLYMTWRRLISGGIDSEAPDSYEDVLANDLHANVWRSVTFLTVSKALDDCQQVQGFHQTAGISELYNDNISAVVSELTTIIQQFTGQEPNDTARKNLVHLAKMSAHLALQFGIHRARMELDFPPFQSHVRIGPEYHHCRDGDMRKGTLMDVDLVVQPGLSRVGDGRRSLTAQNYLVSCHVFPRYDA